MSGFVASTSSWEICLRMHPNTPVFTCGLPVLGAKLEKQKQIWSLVLYKCCCCFFFFAWSPLKSIGLVSHQLCEKLRSKQENRNNFANFSQSCLTNSCMAMTIYWNFPTPKNHIYAILPNHVFSRVLQHSKLSPVFT